VCSPLSGAVAQEYGGDLAATPLGTYHFQCDGHPFMTGDFIVE
jgi:hypothetical protein